MFSEEALPKVAVAYNPDVKSYPLMAPFDPSERYPDYPYPGDEISGENGAYRLVREAFKLLNPEGFGSPGWNPLGAIINPGDVVVIKPNLVEEAGWENGKITHPAVIRPVIDYAYKACGPTGKIIVAEGPWAMDVFEKVVEVTGLRRMIEHLSIEHGVPVSLEDLNKTTRDNAPLIDLGEASQFHGVDRIWYDAHGKELRYGGDPGVGSYRIARTMLDGNVVISIPKVKVHCSAGVTLTMKNMVGIIPSWDGPYDDGLLKDCPHSSNLDRQAGKRGEYPENDTIWRSIADLNVVLLYADRWGRLQPQRQRRYLAVVDGIIAGEKSQFSPRPYPLSTIIVGFDPLTVDAVTSRVMGFDYRRIKSIANSSWIKGFPLGPSHPAEVRILISGGESLNAIYKKALAPELEVYSWRGYIEAEDFSPPELLGYGYDLIAGEFWARVRDVSGVAYTRLAYVRGGRRKMKALKLAKGNKVDGEWRTGLILGRGIEEPILIASDELYNVGRWEVKI